MAGTKLLSLWAVGLPSSPSCRSSEDSHGVKECSSADVSGLTAPSSNEITVAEIGAGPKSYKIGPRGSPIGPRRGAMTRSAWRCCVCGYRNKTNGSVTTRRSSVCSNLDKTNCAARLCMSETVARPSPKKSLNHRRCENCFPADLVMYAPGHDRLWPLHLEPQARHEIEQDKAKDLMDIFDAEFDQMVAERKPKAAERDPLTWQRIGDWPR